MPKTHSHIQGHELAIFHIPADVRQPMSYKMINNNLDGIRRAVGGGYIEIVRTLQMPLLDCNCRAVMAVDEEGLLKRLLFNPRATLFYPHGQGICGDAFLVGEGPSKNSDNGDIFFSLPPAFRDYTGQGAAPAENRPWVRK